MTFIKYTFPLILLLFTLNSCRDDVYNIVDFGAVADGITNNAEAIQSAIDKANANGGGIVVIPPGNFLSGELTLKSDVELQIEKGARLLGSTTRFDYSINKQACLIGATNQKNIALTGEGIIDGQASALITDIYKMFRLGKMDDNTWKWKRPDETSRVKILYIKECTNVKVSGVQLKDASTWVTTFQECDSVIIDNVHIQSTAYWNNDGIDLVDSKNVTVSNCFVNTADDGICLKSEKSDKMCENIVVENCTLRTSASGFKLGTGSFGGFKNIKIRNLHIFDTYRSAIALETVDGAMLENVDIRNVTARNTGNAFVIRLGHRNQSGQMGSLSNIHISDLKVEVPAGKPDVGYPIEGPKLKYPHNLIPASITGIPGHTVQNVTIENVEVIYEGRADKSVAHISLSELDKVPENIQGYPEFSMFGELPSWGLYVRHASGITLKNLKLSVGNEDFRPAIVFDDVKDIELQSLILEGESTSEVQVVLKNVINYSSDKQFRTLNLK